MDLNKCALIDLPLNNFKKLISYLTSHYKSRLYRLYCVNTTGGISTPWKAIKLFLEDETVEKINFFKKNTDDKIFLHCHPSQIE